MNESNLLTGFSGVALIAACWQQVRVVLAKVISLVFVRAKVHAPLHCHVGAYCYRHFRRSPFGLLTFDSNNLFVRPSKRYQVVGFERPSREPMVFWAGWRPIVLSAMPENSVGNTHEGATVTLTTFRGLVDLEYLIVNAIREHNVKAGIADGESRFRVVRFTGMGGSYERKANQGIPGSAPTEATSVGISLDDYRILDWKKSDLGPERAEGRALDSLPFPAEVSTLVEELSRWLTSEDWYRQRGIPWRRGWLLHGKPGTGKTSLVRAIAQDLDLPICVFDLGTMSNREMMSNWREALNHAPCIVLIEDIDAIFEGRKNVTGEEGGGLSFDCLLNCLSGIETANGIFLVITTNRVDMLDEALGAPRSGANGTMISTRPGRVDRALELTTMDEACRTALAGRILADCPKHIAPLVAQGDSDTAAQFQERCAQVALAHHWEGGRP